MFLVSSEGRATYVTATLRTGEADIGPCWLAIFNCRNCHLAKLHLKTKQNKEAKK